MCVRQRGRLVGVRRQARLSGVAPVIIDRSPESLTIVVDAVVGREDVGANPFEARTKCYSPFLRLFTRKVDAQRLALSNNDVAGLVERRAWVRQFLGLALREIVLWRCQGLTFE